MSERAGDQFVEGFPGTPYAVMNWHGMRVVVGRQYSPWFFNMIEARRKRNRSNIMLITGSPGEGKSYFALRLAQIFDKKFDVREQVVFERHKLMKLIGNDSPLKRGQVIIVDEAQYIAGARRWYEEVQKDLMENIEAVRSRGFIIIIVALHINLLDVVIRKYVLSFMIFMERRGVGVVYRLYTARFESHMRSRRLGKVKLQLPDVDQCEALDCLICKHRAKCMTCRAIYERVKREFTGQKSKDAEERALVHIRKAESKKVKDIDLVKILHEARGKFVYTRYGTIELACIRRILGEATNATFSERRANSIRSLYNVMHPKETPPQ